MSFDIALLPKPYIELSLVAGGELAVGEELFFIGFQQIGIGYYGNAVSPPSVQKSITPVAGYQSIKADWWAFTDNISGFADAGGGQVTVTSIGHGRSDGDDVHIAETANYNGDYIISNVTADTFDITASFTGTEVGVWAFHKGLSTPASAIRYNGMTFKWDKYSMMRPDGSYYQWLNLNDPVKMSASGGNEFVWGNSNGTRYGHRRWTLRYYVSGINYNIGTKTFTKIYSDATSNELQDGDAGSSAMRGHFRHPEICYNPVINPTAYSIGQFPINKGRAIMNTNGATVTTDDIINKLLSKPELADMFLLSHYGSERMYGGKPTLVANAHMQGYNAGALYDIKDLNLTLLGGNLDHGNYIFKFERCQLTTIGCQRPSWVSDACDYIDSERVHEGNAFIIAHGSSQNSNIRSSVTSYQYKFSGRNFIGGYPGANAFFQWRYQRARGAGSYHSDAWDINVKNCYMRLTDSATDVVGEERGGTMTNFTFDNEASSYSIDVYVYVGYVLDDTSKRMDMLNVTSTRNDGKLKIQWNSASKTGLHDTWYSRYGIKLSLVDKDGMPIEGATATLSSDAETDTKTTDIDGKAEVIALGYTIHYDQSDQYGTTSEWETQTLTVSKAGYQTIKIKDMVIKEGKEWTMEMLSGDGTKNVIYNSTIYNSVIK